MSFLAKFVKLTLLPALAISLSACGDEATETMNEKPVIRGLKTIVVKEQERSTTRKYPSVLQPSSVSTISFEIAGSLAEINLNVGQLVKKGEVLARIDPTTLKLQVDSAEAAVRQAQSASQTMAEDYERKFALLKKGVVTKAASDQAKNAAESAKEQLVQAKKQLATAKNNLTKTELKAPLDGIINTVEVNSFANVSPGAPVATLYSADKFEASFSVSYDVINLLAVGKKAIVRLADNPAIVLNAHVSELGARADTVSSFPTVVTVDSQNAGLKAGMAIEVSIEFAVENGKGFTLPLSVLALEGKISKPEKYNEPGKAFIYVFDEASKTVKRRAVMIGGVRENSLIIIDGLKLGERVASAGVSFLRDGQVVKLLPSSANGE